MNDISLTVGDWSGDGHDKDEVFYIKCNLNVTELQDAYKQGVKETGIDVSKCCEEYEDSRFDKEDALKLLKEGKAFEFISKNIQKDIDDSIDDADDDDLTIYCIEMFAVLWLCVARIAQPTLKIQFNKNPPNIDIGGYGLFY